jgi:RHS repeat-associated protein
LASIRPEPLQIPGQRCDVLNAERDEFFYTNGWQLLEDRGNGPFGYTADQYVWLDGQPIAVRRARFDANYVSASQTEPNCSWGDDGASCGWRFLVNDITGRTVLVLDDNRLISNVNEYHAFGNMNRMTWWAESAHPYGVSQQFLMATPTQPTRKLNLSLKVNFGMFDVEDPYDSVKIFDSANTLKQTMTGYHSSVLSSNWITPLADGQLKVRIGSDPCNAPPGTTVCGTWDYAGATIESVEYRRSQPGAQPWVHRLRLPGQYYDAETGLFENWNRYYDPEHGRYLSMEPLMANPNAIRLRAKEGSTLQPYAYASNNPIGRADFNGAADVPYYLQAPSLGVDLAALARVAAYAGAGAVTAAGAGLTGASIYYTLDIGRTQFPDPGAGVPNPFPDPKAGTIDAPILPGAPSGGVPIPNIRAPAIPDICPLPPPSNDDCRRIAAQCREECVESSIPTRNNGFSFWNCQNACLAEHGCPPGMY